MGTKLLLDVDEARELLGVGRSTLYELLATGSIESVKIGRARRVPVDAIQDYVARLRSEAREPVA